MKRFASIDIGTNSVLLLVAERSDVGGRATLVAVEQASTITRLGEGVDRTGRLAARARARTRACLEQYGQRIRALGAEHVEIVATSAMRDARGGEEFASEIESLLGVRPRIIAGLEEAELTFVGALSGLSLDGDSVCVFDIGGGSTELIVAQRGASELDVSDARSLDIGSVRLYERCLTTDPPSDAEYESLRRVVRSALESAPTLSEVTHAVGVAGTITTLAAIELGLESYDADRVHGSTLGITQLTRLRKRLWSMSLEERKSIVGLHPLRADVIVAGAVIAEEVLTRTATDTLVVSDRGVRWGLAERAFERGAASEN